MEESMKKLLIACILAMVVPSVLIGQAPAKKAAPAKGQSAEQEVVALERAWLDASMKYDAAWFERHLADTFVNTDEKGVVTNKAALVGDVKDHANKFEALSYDAVNGRAYGDTVITTGIVVVKGTSKGKDASGRFAWTDTWLKRGGQWQCVASHSSTIAAK
jgi:ketosteroid isomerase-like protein